MTMTWQNGRQLATLTNEDEGLAVTYTYNPNGLRTKKSITTSTGSTTNVEYVYENGLLMRMTYGERIFDFSYDASGNPIGFNYTIPSASVSSYYYYGLNSRGDIEVLYTSAGSISAIYEYDAYGQLLSVKNSSGTAITGDYSIAHLNPLRYRSYVYDTETGLYYLQSRYYDPTTCRFINADVFYETGQGINGYNMFAYCGNNPIKYSDSSGEMHIREGGGGCCLYPSISPFAYGGGAGYGAGGASGGAVTVQHVKIIRPYVVTTTTTAFGAGTIIGTAISSSNDTSSQTASQDIAFDMPQQKHPKYQAYFPENPDDFHPKGLELFKAVPKGQGGNGGIYKWRIPESKITIFEWDEDYNYGPHYHAMIVEWDSEHCGDHLKPGSPVPEPWNTMYFGG